MFERLATAGHPVRFLASVKSVAEAEICVAGGADVIDCKDPTRGALGALDPDTVRAVRAAVPAHIPVSATIGDLPSDPDTVANAVEKMAAAGIDFIKIGCFPDGDPGAMIARAGELPLNGTRLVGVLFPDLMPSFSTVWTLIDGMARANFAGILLDTADKQGPPLTGLLTWAEMRAIISGSRRAGLFAGLAGSLGLADIPEACAHRPDILGFRGALCHGRARTGEIDPQAVAAVAAAVAEASTRTHPPPTFTATEF